MHRFIKLELLLFLYIIIHCKQYYSQKFVNDYCVFNDTSGSDYTLDLRQFDNITLQYNDSNGNQFPFTPCGNRAHCSGNTYSAMQLLIVYTSECTVWAFWNGGYVQPYYNKTSQQWIFTYDNGQNCWPEPAIQMTYIWECNPNIKTYKIDYVGGNGGNHLCDMKMVIESSVACVN